jgi:Flp pilus assembly pilin Flp
MGRVTNKLVTFLKHTDGLTGVEYAAMLALVTLICVVALTTLGPNAGGPLPSTAAMSAPACAAD